MFVTFEGPEGGGKSTLIKALEARFHDACIDSLITREPGGAGELGAKVREVLLNGGIMSPLTEVFLFLADRTHHVETVIQPALREGKVVLCDRFVDSTIVYQGYARGLDIETLRHWNEVATDHVTPDLTFLLDLDAELGLARQTKNDRLDREPVAFHQKVRAGFLAEAARTPVRWHILDASAPAEAVLHEAVSVLGSHLGRTF